MVLPKNEVFVGNPGAGMPSDIRSAFQARLVIEQCRVARVNVRATDDYVRLTKRITLATCVIAVATVVNVLLQVLLNWASFSK